MTMQPPCLFGRPHVRRELATTSLETSHLKRCLGIQPPTTRTRSPVSRPQSYATASDRSHTISSLASSAWISQRYSSYERDALSLFEPVPASRQVSRVALGWDTSFRRSHTSMTPLTNELLPNRPSRVYTSYVHWAGSTRPIHTVRPTVTRSSVRLQVTEGLATDVLRRRA